jgi:hypothetical protein
MYVSSLISIGRSSKSVLRLATAVLVCCDKVGRDKTAQQLRKVADTWLLY